MIFSHCFVWLFEVRYPLVFRIAPEQFQSGSPWISVFCWFNISERISRAVLERYWQKWRFPSWFKQFRSGFAKRYCKLVQTSFQVSLAKFGDFYLQIIVSEWHWSIKKNIMRFRYSTSKWCHSYWQLCGWLPHVSFHTCVLTYRFHIICFR